MASPEHVRWAIEDILRLILPQLDALHTAQELWSWRCRPARMETSFPGFADIQRAFALLEAKPTWAIGLKEEMYAARCLPDSSYEPLLLAWERLLQPRAEGENGFAQSLRCAAAFRALQQTPLDGPL